MAENIEVIFRPIGERIWQHTLNTATCSSLDLVNLVQRFVDNCRQSAIKFSRLSTGKILVDTSPTR